MNKYPILNRYLVELGILTLLREKNIQFVLRVAIIPLAQTQTQNIILQARLIKLFSKVSNKMICKPNTLLLNTKHLTIVRQRKKLFTLEKVETLGLEKARFVQVILAASQKTGLKQDLLPIYQIGNTKQTLHLQMVRCLIQTEQMDQ